MALMSYLTGDHLCLPWQALELPFAFGFHLSDNCKCSNCNTYCNCNTVSE